MTVPLDDTRRAHLTGQLRGFFLEEFDEDLTDFRAARVLDWFLEHLGPAVYNQAVQDARGWMLKQLDEIDGDVHVPEQV